MSEQDKTWSKHDQTLKEYILRPVALFLAQTQSDQTRSCTGRLKSS